MRLPIFLSVLLLVSRPVFAHHSDSAFDREKVIAFEATVVRVQWRNPHVYLYLADRNDVEWQFETDATPIMRRSGWSRDTFKEGDLVSVRGVPDRNPDKKHALLITMEGADGVAMGSMNRAGAAQLTDGDASTTSFAGVWKGSRTGTFDFFESFRAHPLTEKGRVEQARFDETMNPASDCIPWSTPFFLLANGLYLTEVTLHEDRIIVRNEFYDAIRTIYLDGRGHPQSDERTIQGHSIGTWEGSTLVVDTNLFSDHRAPVPNTGIPSGAQKHVIERWTLSEDGKQIRLSFVLDDPEFLAEPFSANYTWTYVPQYEALSIECNPDVAQQFLQ